jgi:hypothetical protein
MVMKPTMVPSPLWSRAPLECLRRIALAGVAALVAMSASATAPVEPAGLAETPILDIKFRDFFRSPIDAYGLEASDRLRMASGKRVRLHGYMVAQEETPLGRFFLTPMPTRMSEHADGDANDLPPSTVVVVMPETDRSRLIPYRPGLMQLTGVLQVGRQELDDGRVCWLQLLLDPPATPPVTK